MTAVSPSPGLDALVFAWRGRAAGAAGGGAARAAAGPRRRPCRCCGAPLLDAATVAVTDVAVDTAARALLSSKPLLQHVAGEAAAGAVAARRMLRLARVAARGLPDRPAAALTCARAFSARLGSWKPPWPLYLRANYSVQVIPPERSLLYSGLIPARASTSRHWAISRWICAA